MKSIPQYKFHKTKYGEELLVDIVSLDSIRQYIDKHPIHTLSYFDITFITKGSGLFFIDNHEYALQQGDILFSRPGEVREWQEVSQGYALIFEEEFLLSFFNDPSFIRNLSYFSAHRSSAQLNVSNIYTRIETLIHHILEEINSEQSKDKHVLRAMLYEILTLLNREYASIYATDQRKSQNRHIDLFVNLVDRYFKTHHDTGHYANELCLTPNYLNEIVQAHIGISPKAYIQNRIIQEAQTLLSYTDLSVSEVADKLYFESPSYFIRLFRKQTNLTPLEYRQSTLR